MPEEMKIGCARPVGGPSVEDGTPVLKSEQEEKKNQKEISMIKVGQKAPDFTAPAYHNGKFISIRLSEFFGKWIVLCFYPGDFTFV
jgi:peroxiredoxin (alkyl hydroperoxide reductase subunit C)